MILNIVLLVLGFIILIKGADIFVDGASSIAGNLKIPKILIGLTIFAFGTSIPEFAVSVKAIIAGNHDIVLGNVVGSNILNIVLIVGVSSLFHNLIVKDNTLKKELPIMLLITALFAVLLSDGLFDNTVNAFTRSDGIVLSLFFFVYIYYLISISRKKFEEVQKDKYLPMLKSIIYTIVGIIGIVIGSNLAVNSASSIATTFGLSDKFIGLTIIALGTSLPELVTSITATRKGEYDLAIGNVIGSNIFNISLVVGVPVAIFGGTSAISFNYIDIAVMLLCALLLFAFASSERKLTKFEGLLFLIVFIMYYSYIFIMR